MILGWVGVRCFVEMQPSFKGFSPLRGFIFGGVAVALGLNRITARNR